MTTQTASPTRLHGRWLLLARLAWAVVFLTLSAIYAFGFLTVHETLSTICDPEPCSLREQIRRTDAGEQIMRSAGPPVGYADRLRPEQVEALETLGFTLDQYGWLGALQLGLPALVLLLIAAGLFWWKSDDWMALLASAMVATFPIHNMPLAFTLTVHQPAWEWVGNLFSVVALSCLLIFPLIFPTGQFVPRWTRWMAIYDVTAAVMVSFLPILEVFGDALGRPMIGVLVLLPFGIGIYAQLYRYFRVARPAERQQFKWVVVGLAGTIVIQFAVLIPLNGLLSSPAFSADLARALVLSAIPDTLWQLNNLLIAVCIVISVMRYRLWDIDLIISRTLVYSTLIAVITGLYVLVVGSLSSLLQNQNDLAAPLVALLIVAAFVRPLLRALQNIVNRLLRFDPARRDESESLQRSSEQPDKAQEEHIQIKGITEVVSSPDTRLHGRWLLIARLTWAAVFITLTAMYAFGFLSVREALSTVCEEELCTLNRQISHRNGVDKIVGSAGPPIGSADRLRPEQVEALKTLGLTLNQYGWLGALQMGIPAAIYLLIAAGLFWWKSDNWMALFASVMIATVPLQSMPLVFTLERHTPAWEWVSKPFGIVALSFFILLPLIFPTGQCIPRWTRWVAVYDVIGSVVISVFQNPITENPSVLKLVPIFLLIAFGAGVYAQLYRYFRVASPVERQQIKWGIVGLAGFVCIGFTVLLPLNALLTSQASVVDPARALILSTIPDTLFHVINLFIPVAIVIAVLRYRLWDVDILINRTIVYGALTASVVVLYVLIVGWSSIGLQTQNNLAGSVFAVLVIAFLFRPLHQRLQRIADRFVPVSQTALPAEQHNHQIATPEGQSAADTKLRGRWLLVARLTWVAVFAVLTIMYVFGFLAVRDILSTVCESEPCTLGEQIRHTEAGEQILEYIGPPVGYADPLRTDQVEALQRLGLTLEQYGWLATLQVGIPILVYLLIAAGLFWQKSDDWMVLFVSMMVATFPLHGMGMPLPFTLVVRQPAWEWVYFPAMAAALSFLLIFPMIFPTGQFVPRWTRWIAVFEVAGALIVTCFQYSILRFAAGELVLVYVYIAFGAGVYAQLYRYFRVATTIERQQLKWVIVGLAAFISTTVLLLVPLNGLLVSRAAGMDPARALLLSTIPDILFRIICFFVPVSIVISVLRYRLWDIDIIINRTLVYGALTGIVVSAFVILVGFLSVLFQSSGNSIIAIIATGLMALLFNPLRQRLQRGVNHLMYGERDEPYTALSRLGRRLETTLAPESVLPTVVTTVRDVLRLPYVAIYLQQDSHGYKIVAESASPSLRIENGRIRVPGMEREGRCIPLVHQGETIGYIVLGPRASNEAFSATDLRLLEDLAPQVGVAVHAVRLTADLQRSREQLVLAREEERRRLRRDLHDGLGPQLAGLALKLETIRNRLRDDPLADSLLADAVKRTQDATADIRHLVYELRPPTLDELGLVMALREGVTQFTQQGCNDLNITLDAPESLPALPAAVEVAVYRITQEALTNVIRHADAHTCHIRLSLDESMGLLCLEVQDDGKGLLMKRRAGVGLNSMRERAEELGGTFTITPVLTGGTLLTAKLPCRLDLKFAAQEAMVASDEER